MVALGSGLTLPNSAVAGRLDSEVLLGNEGRKFDFDVK